jgi:uncharacterized protein YceK
MRNHFTPILLLSLMLCSGCGTIMAHHLGPDDSPSGVYRGVRLDCLCFGGDQPALYLMILDLPLSLAADTLVLPYDVIYSLGGKEEPADSER